MPDAYLNPGSAIDINAGQGDNPFWSAFQGARREQMLQPFVDQARQSGQMDLMRKQMETGEFLGQEAQQQRSLQRRSDMATQQSNIDLQPARTKRELRQIDEDIRSMPGMTDAKIAQAAEITRNAKAAPHREMLSQLGQMYDVLKDAPEADRPFLYAGRIKQMQGLGIDVAKELPEFANYDPRHLPDLAAIRHAQIFSPEQVGKERLTMLQGQNQTGVANIHGNAARDVANINADAHRDAARIAAEPKVQETPPKAIARLRKQLAANPDDQESKDEYKYYIDDAWDKKQEKDISLMMLKMKVLNSSSEQERAAAKSQYDEAMYGFYTEKGIPIIKNGYRWKGGNPAKKSSWEPVK